MSDAVVFVGPSLPAGLLAGKYGLRNGCIDAGHGHRICIRPPVAEGDVTRSLEGAPALVAIIDGYFESAPSVWHKEILHAMSAGVHVLGAASMGALRAAELAAFGMEGVGHIFENYHRGHWEDDDEVTVTHGPAELGYPMASEAMANIRYSLQDACEQGIINVVEWLLLVSEAKRLFYKQRHYEAMLQAGEGAGMAPARVAALRDWLARHKRDVKREDAELLLDTLIARLQSPIEKKAVTYYFEDTAIWQRSRSGAR